MDVIGRFVVIVLAVILVIIFPLQYIAQSQDETMENVVYTYADELTNLSRHQGYISLDMYEEFVHKLDMTGEVYDITIESSHPITGKEAAKQTVGDTIPDINLEKTSFIDKCSCKDYACEGYICGDDFCNNSKCKSGGEFDTCQYKKGSHELLLSAQGEINSFAAHVHTDACYSGHNHSINGCSYHSHTGNSVTGGGCYGKANYHSHSSGCYGSGTCGGSISGHNGTISFTTCGTCKSRVVVNTYTYSCSSCGSSYGSASIYRCGHGGSSLSGRCSRFVSTLTCTTSTSTIFSYSLNCGRWEGYQCGLSNDPNSKCSSVVTSLSASEPLQRVTLGDNIILTAIATMLDESTKIVNCISSGYDRNKLGTQTVTLTYSGLVDTAKKTGTKTCTTEVIVNSPIKLIGITASSDIIEVDRYQQPVITVIATYDDDSSREVTDYTLIGYNSGLIGRQEVTVSYTEYGITKTTLVSVVVNNIPVNCTRCGRSYTLDDNDLDNGCPYCKSEIVKIMANTDFIRLPYGSKLPITVIAVYADGNQYEVEVSEWSSNFRPDLIGIQEVTINYLGLTTSIIVEVTTEERNCSVCGLNYSFNEDGTDPGCPYCSKEVISIDVIEESVTIEKHMNLPITVMGTFKDGHTALITDWTTNLVTDSPGTYEATIYYQAATDTISVTIVGEGRSICPYCGLAYDFSDNPGGCPDCSKTLVGIEASLRSGGTKVMYKSQLNLELVLIYMDTHRRITYTGWTVDGYRSDKLGTQTITIHYESLVSTMIIEVVDELPKAICQEGHEYYLDGDGSDPGCPYCNQEENKEKAVFYFENTYTAEIIETLYRDGIYQLREGDYLTITVTKRNTSLRSKIKSLFFGANREIAGKKYTFGGEVLK